MTYKEFLKIMLTYHKIYRDISEAYEIGIDLLEGKFKLSETTYKLFLAALEPYYNEKGIEGIEWYCFENSFGQGGLTAEDKDGNPIAYSWESLYELLKTYKK